jgi:hypothetical protein
MAAAGCSKPEPISVSVDDLSVAAPAPPAADAVVESPVAQSPMALAAFENAADPAPAEAKPERPAPKSEPQAAPNAEPAVDWATHFRKRIEIFANTAYGAALNLGQHVSTSSYDQQCSMLNGLVKHARSADEEEQFGVVLQHAEQIVLQLKLGRTYLWQRDELDGMSSPGAVKLLRDTYQACGRHAREVQQEIADLRRELEAR